MSLPVILILGKSGAGKDTAGEWIAEAQGGVTLAFADKLKEICGELFGFTREDMYTAEGKKRRTSLVRYDGLVGEKADEFGVSRFWAVREILQHIGTEGFRAVDPDVWVRYALKKAEYVVGHTTDPSWQGVVVITDGRFRSECEMVWRAGGEVWRVRRPQQGSVGLAGHSSETEQDSIADSECQAVIENDSTLEVFHERVMAALEGWRKRQ